MNRLVDPEMTRVELVELQRIKIQGNLRWRGKAKFPGSPRPRSIIVFQLGDDIVAIPAFCPHEKADLSLGRFVEPFVLECPAHQNRYDLRTGAIKTFRVEADGERMYLLWKRTDKEPIAATFAGVVQIGKRAEDERLRTVEAELEAAREAARAREAHLVSTLAQLEGMLKEVEAQKTTILDSRNELSQLHELVQRVTDSMSEVLIVLSVDGRIRSVNARFRALLGYTSDETTSLSLLSIVDIARARELDPELMKDGSCLGLKSAELELDLIGRDGSRAEHLLRIAPLFNAAGKREGAVVVGTDIRTIKEAERKIRSAYARVTTLLDNMRQAVFVILPSGEITEPISRYSETVFGRSILGETIDDVLYSDLAAHGETYEGIRAVFLTVFGSEEFQWDLMSDMLPRRILKKHEAGRVQVLKVEYCPLYSAEALVEKLMVIVEDVTLVELLEEEKRKGERQTQVLEELAKNSVDTLRGFLSSAYDQLRECRRNLDCEDAESRAVLLRNLHTLKGTARVLGLSLIGQAAHEAENVATSQSRAARRSDFVSASDRLRAAISHVHREVAEYSEVAERFLHLPNELESKAVEELHAAMTVLDARLPCSVNDSCGRAYRDCMALLHSKAADVREAANAAGNDEAAHVAKQLEHALAQLANAPANSSASAAADLMERYETLLDRVVRSRLRSRAGSDYSLATSTWSSLYHEAFLLTRAVLTTEASATGQILWSADRARELADALNVDDLSVTFGQIAVQARQSDVGLTDTVKSIWSHLSLHSTLESLVLARPEERAMLLSALLTAETAPETLERLIDGGRLRVGSLTGFLILARHGGYGGGEFIATIGALFGLSSARSPRPS